MNTPHKDSAFPFSDEFLRTLIYQTKDFAIIGMDVQGVIVIWNAGAQDLFGYETEEAIGKHGNIIFIPDDRSSGVADREFKEALQTGKASNERWHLRKDGSRFWGSGVVTALRDDEGHLRGFAKIIRDRTDLKLAGDQLQEINRSLELRVAERTSQLKKLFADLVEAEQRERQRIAVILHDDLQQMLVAIVLRLSTAHFIATSIGNEELIALTHTARDQLDSAIETTRTLAIDLVPPVLKGKDFGLLVHWLAIKTNEVHGLKVDVEVDGDVSIPDEHIRTMLTQVLRELLFNIFKHAGVQTAKIDLKGEDEYMVITVQDDGKGFDIESVENRIREGDGFGLHHAMERVELAGGTFKIDSQPEKGTRITLIIPRS